jgi:hypothetical protein
MGSSSTPQNWWYATLECLREKSYREKPRGKMNLSLRGVTWLVKLSSHVDWLQGRLAAARLGHALLCLSHLGGLSVARGLLQREP